MMIEMTDGFQSETEHLPWRTAHGAGGWFSASVTEPHVSVGRVFVVAETDSGRFILVQTAY